uniref:ACT domain-containing protein n=1 Tax=Salmonella enterica TaxID=28901 RepID=UPI003D9C6094
LFRSQRQLARDVGRAGAACGVGKEVFGVLEPFNIRMICYGASSHNLCFLVPGDDAEKVVQKLHQNLFE